MNQGHMIMLTSEDAGETKHACASHPIVYSREQLSGRACLYYLRTEDLQREHWK